MDWLVECVLEYKVFFGDLLECGEKVDVDIVDIEVWDIVLIVFLIIFGIIFFLFVNLYIYLKVKYSFCGCLFKLYLFRLVKK